MQESVLILYIITRNIFKITKTILILGRNISSDSTRYHNHLQSSGVVSSFPRVIVISFFYQSFFSTTS
jgi:hypothetical protein